MRITRTALFEVVGSQQRAFGTEQFFVAAGLLAPSAMTGAARAAAVHLRLDPTTQRSCGPPSCARPPARPARFAC
ncbi:hypothetical protein ACFV4M_34735 [Kitasatospora indigofera]|uniref:hypothetical protein n=1 Tax=Kitasatospora indigofera TaxID=67307 RepID=UPI0036582A41